MKEKVIYVLAILGTVADYMTTQIGLTHTRITEANPFVNPILEGVSAMAGSFIIFRLGNISKLNRRLVSTLAAIPACIPFLAAIHNIIVIMLAHII